MEKNNKIKELEQEAEKLRQENEMLKNEIQNLRSYCMVTFGESHPEMRKCIHELENEALKAQVSGLVGAIQGAIGISDLWVPVVASEEDRHEVEALHDMQSEFKRVLSTLPSQYLEIAKAKELLLSLCEAFIKKGHHIDGCVRRYQPYPSRKTDDKKDICDCRRTFILSQFETLRTLQQAQEKK